MIYIEEELSHLNYLVQLNQMDHNTMIFDIETTGFQSNSMIYLFACIINQNHSLVFKQWLCESIEDELSLLYIILDTINQYPRLISFNGESFDYPFILKRMKHQLVHPPNPVTHIDLYKQIRPFAKALPLPNIKFKTLEQYVGIHREDAYSGGELIEDYFVYLATQSELLKMRLLLHNREDVIHTLYIMPLVSLLQVIKHPTYLRYENSIWSEDTLSVRFAIEPIYFEAILPSKSSITRLNHSSHGISYQYDQLRIDFQTDYIQITVPIRINSPLQYPLSPSKDYVFHITENKPLHKSLSVFIDNSQIRKIKKEECYLTKIDDYIPIYSKPIGTQVFFEGTNAYLPKSQLIDSPALFFLLLPQIN